MLENAKSNRGFSLIELLVAMVIIGVSVMGLMEMSTVVMDNNLKNEIRNTAVEILSDHVNDLSNRPYNNVPVGVLTQVEIKTIRNFYERFTIVDNITVFSSGYKNIASKISWNYRNINYNYTTDTVVNKNE